MTGHGNPYQEWLGVESTNPSFYELLEIASDEQDAQVIKEAADRALSQVRSFKPGEMARQWATLLDELDLALTTLSDPALRSEYDQNLANGVANAALAGSLQTATEPEQAEAPPNVDTPSPEPASPDQPVIEENHSANTAAVASTASPSDELVPTIDVTPSGTDPTDPMAPLDLSPTGTAGDPMAPLSVTEVTSVPAEPQAVETIPVQSSTSSLVMEEETTASAAAMYRAKSNARTKGVWVATGILGIAIAGIIVAIKFLPTSDTESTEVAQKNDSQTSTTDDEDVTENDDTQNDTEDAGADNETGDEGGMDNPESGDPMDKPMEDPEDLPEDKPEDKPEPKPTPEPDPTPEPEPEPEPTPDPESEPEPPTPEELEQLSTALKAGREALQQRDLAVAAASAQTALKLAKLDEHVVIAQRLHDMVEYTSVFYRLFNEALGKVEIGSGLTIGTSVEAGVAEITPEKVTLRINGNNRSWTRDELPAGVVLAFANKYFTDFQMAPVIKGAFLISQTKPLESHIEQAVKLFAEGAANGAPSEGLELFLEDSYEFKPPSDESNDDTDSSDSNEAQSTE